MKSAKKNGWVYEYWNHRCTECGEAKATVLRYDAGNQAHWFHPECWHELMRWLAGLSFAPSSSGA